MGRALLSSNVNVRMMNALWMVELFHIALAVLFCASVHFIHAIVLVVSIGLAVRTAGIRLIRWYSDFPLHPLHVSALVVLGSSEFLHCTAVQL